MENQHRKIVGYRELTQEDIDLMNRIKAAGRELLQLQVEVNGRNSTHKEVSESAYRRAGAEVVGVQGSTIVTMEDARKLVDPSSPEALELARIEKADAFRWSAIAKTDIQTGVMALVRAVAQPTDC